MTAAAPTLTEIAAAAGAVGLHLRGAFIAVPDDAVPPQPDGRPSRSLVLLGNLGGSLWPDFAAGPEFADGRPDPMNRWSLRVAAALAERFGGLALFPFGGPPYLPFLRWAQKAEGLKPSPLGMLIHPVYGLWHAYRGALALPETLALPHERPAAHPCDTCAEKPCLSACPVDAFSESGCDVPACVGHLRVAAGDDCLTGGCLARRACPVGSEYLYAPPQAAFHMQAFVAAQSELQTFETES
ncbi:ferredoxin [Pelagibius sp.]|uniref:ferredoxin n=1 Tax=Pelagibius sp. TaxID=1931238 RepID=UPI003B505D38